MRPIAYNYIYHLSNELTNPPRAAWLMRDYMRKAILVSNTTMTKDTILKFNKARIGFNDVERIAEQVVNKQKSGDKSRSTKYRIVKDLMKHKLDDSIKCIKNARVDLKKSNENLSKIVRKGTFVRYEFKEVVDKEIKSIWKNNKSKNQKKVKWANYKREEKEPAPDTIKGVIVDDKGLEELETELKKPNEPENKAVILGGVKVDKYEEAVLMIPPNHTTYPKILVEEVKTELEKCVIKCRWNDVSEQTKNENENKIKESEDTRDKIDNNKKDAMKVYDANKKCVDLKNLRATDLKNNKRVVIPPLDDDQNEIRRNNVKTELLKVVENYRMENCDKFGNILENNLKDQEVKTIKNLKKRMKDEKLVCYETDKTGKFTLDTLENYSKKMEKHTKCDKMLSEKELKTLENKVNQHMDHWIKITKPGENEKQMKRIKSNLKTVDNQIPILRGTNKDHKEAADAKTGPDVRPIMGAMVGPNIGLSELGSIFVRAIADEADTGLVVKSTEEMLNKFEVYNDKRKQLGLGTKKLIIGSMDIDKFYPNIIAEKSAKSVREMWEESELVIEGIEYDEVSMYLGKYLTIKEIEEEGFADLVYIKIKKRNPAKRKKKKASLKKKTGRKYCRKSKRGKKPLNDDTDENQETLDISVEREPNENNPDGINDTKPLNDDTNEYQETLDISVEKESNENNPNGINDTNHNKKQKILEPKNKEETFLKPKRKPNTVEKRKLFGKALELMLIVALKNHVYKFGNRTRVQNEGGPIGLKLTGEIADCIMIQWDKKLMKELEKVNIEPMVYTRFKDDIDSS